MKIYVKQLYDEKGNRIPIVLPERSSEVAAGYDIIATSDPKIVGQQINHAWQRIDYIEYETNLFISPETKTSHVLIHPRSSISKYNLVLANSIGLIDNDYRGMVICRFKYIWQPEDMWFVKEKIDKIEQVSDTKWEQEYKTVMIGFVNTDKIYKKNDRIAQLVIEQTVTAEWELVDDLDETKRGNGCFGSTDTKRPEFPENIKIREGESGLIDIFKKSGHDIPTPHKDTYVNSIKEREKGIQI